MASGTGVAVVVTVNCFLAKFCAAFGAYLMLGESNQTFPLLRRWKISVSRARICYRIEPKGDLYCVSACTFDAAKHKTSLHRKDALADSKILTRALKFHYPEASGLVRKPDPRYARGLLPRVWTSGGLRSSLSMLRRALTAFEFRYMFMLSTNLILRLDSAPKLY